jgi:diguanylate cyclase (GGDEF)-like protein
MAKAITGRITLNLIAGIIITVVTVMSTIFWMAARHNEAAARSTETMVVGGVEAMGKRLQQLANDYAWWEEAYDAWKRGDAEWINANIGTGITDTKIADLLVIISPEGKVDYEWMVEGAPDRTADIITPAMIATLRGIADKMPVDNSAARTGYTDAPSAPMMLGIQHITPFSRASEVKSSDLPILVFGQYLAGQRLADLGKSFLIDDLTFARGDAGADPLVAVHDLAGRPLGHFQWTPPKPGDALLGKVLLPIGIALTLFCVVALVTAFRARKLAIQVTNSEQEAVVAARTDSMTGLKNRMGFTELVTSPESAAACAEGHLAVIYLDVNGFKAVNDSIGHHGGDMLVKTLAERLASVLVPGAELARVGGDEFAVLMSGKSAGVAAAAAASAIVHSFDRPFTVAGFEFHVSAAVGYAVADAGAADPTELVRRADVAMYHAKGAAERDAVVYHPTMETGALEKKQVETGLRRAIEQGELQVYYQPVVRAADLGMVCVEALVRWTSPEFGAVSPALFIPVAEETGLIHDIGRFVIDRACRDLLRWPDLKVAINISPVQLRDPNFANDLLAVVERHGLSPHQFELELTEGILVSNPTIAKRKLATLKELGFVLALDDFGTGFSSIGYLRQFPFDILKVDRSFVRDIGLNQTANALIQSLVSLGDAMDLDVIAEGIENEDQLRLLRLVQCEYVQGFHISRPVPAAEIDALVAAEKPQRAVKTLAVVVAGDPELRAIGA